MCAASESVEINASTKKGISQLGKVHRGLCEYFKHMNKIEDSLPIRAKLTMETWNFKLESHVGRSSNVEHKRLHDMDDTAYNQQKSDSEQLPEECAAGVSSKFDPSTKTINEHGEGKFEIRKKTEEEGMKTDKGRRQDSCASFKNIKPLKKDSLRQRPKLKIVTCKVKTESHMGKSSHEEQQSLEDTEYHQLQSDSGKHREVCAAFVSSKFEPSTKAINAHGQVSQNSHAPGKQMKPSIIIKDSLLYKSKQKQKRRTLKSGSSHHIIKHKKSYCSQCLLQKKAKLENDLYKLEKRYTEEKRVTLELKKENVALKHEVQHLRDQINEIKNEDNKEIKKKPETSVRKFDIELNITADEFNQVSQLEMTTSDLENEIGQKRDTLRVRTLVSEQEKRHTYKNEQREIEEHIRKQESIRQRRIYRLQSEITQLQQEFHDIKIKFENQIETSNHKQNQQFDIIRQLQAQNERYRLFLESRNMRLIHENSLLQKDSSMERESRK
uniref:uncharacterized protein LOC120885689 n=1 Tax=Ictidomys tridecemlineatus TaxID=43179 RepID=UPI001A9D8D2D|nr:uncharacterized protein LOC120885689 [Ictidomys tridecemlineatus]